MWKLKVNCLLLQVVTKLLTFRHHGGTEASDGTAIRPFNLRWSCQDPTFVLELVVTCPHNKAFQILICLVQLPAALQAAPNKPKSLQGFPGTQNTARFGRETETPATPSQSHSDFAKWSQEKLKPFSSSVVTPFSMPPVLLPSCNGRGWAGSPSCFFCVILSHSSGRKSRVSFQCQTHFLPRGEPSWRDHTTHCQSQRQGLNFHRLCWMFWFQPRGLCITGRSEVTPEGNRGVALPFPSLCMLNVSWMKCTVPFYG